MTNKELSAIKITSPDLREGRLNELKRLFPDLFDGEGNIDEKALRDLASPDGINVTEKFRFEWAGKLKSKRKAFEPSRATLIADKDRSIDFDNTQNMIIEGDNLEALKLLQTTYFERVKCIYIDPPYNTGNDFIYPDDYSEGKKAYWQKNGTVKDGVKLTAVTEATGRKHSNWLNMMQSRLLLARQLLRDDGVIFISVDDNEQSNLKKLCDEVFGEKNFVAQFIWNTEGHTDNQYDVKVNHEYLLLYAKSTTSSIGHVIDPNTREESNLWKGFAENSITKNGSANPPSEVILPKGFPCKVETVELSSNPPDELFFQKVRDTGYITRQITKEFDVNYPIRMNKISVIDSMLIEECKVFSGWANVDKLRQFIEDGCKPIEEENGNVLTFYLSEKGVVYYRRDREKARNVVSVLRNMGTTEQMRSELERFGIPFQYPKPKELIRYLLQLGAETGGIVLDFFAGSGTAAHAVMCQNVADDENRHYILVQIPEYIEESHPAFKEGYKTISDVCIERVKRVGEKIRKEDPNTKADTGFRVYRLTDSHFPQNLFTPDPDKSDFENTIALEEHLKANRQAELFGAEAFNDVVSEISLKNGYGLFYDLERLEGEFPDNAVYKLTGNGKSTLICLDEHLKEKTVDTLQSHSDEQLIVSRHALDTTKKWMLQSAFKDNLRTV